MANIRIVNKAKDLVTIKYKNGKTEQLTWDAFNSAYIIKDKVYAELRPEIKVKFDKAEEIISTAITSYFEANSKDPKLSISSYLSLGTYVKELSELLEEPEIEAINLIRSRLTSFKAKYGAQRREIKSKSEPRVYSTSNSKVATFGDLPELQKLKAQMKGK